MSKPTETLPKVKINQRPERSPFHSKWVSNSLKLQSSVPQVLEGKSKYNTRIHRKVVEIYKHTEKFNRKEGFKMSGSSEGTTEVTSTPECKLPKRTIYSHCNNPPCATHTIPDTVLVETSGTFVPRIIRPESPITPNLELTIGCWMFIHSK